MKKKAGEEDLMIGKYLREKRKYFNLTQKRLGEQLSVSFQQIQKYEKGSNKLSLSNAFKLASIIDFDIKEIYEILENKNE